ncbi:MAG TPA: acyl-CoA dehydrogenase [Flavobacteriales bacterium]|jgi:alkylation response protein AidB-like acyl-CoA dehydrogenase|nr:acyl-CoA dehydrogenase [Flavobacteriales bacterium]
MIEEIDISEREQMIVEMVRDFASKEITPFRRKWDDDQIFPVDLFKKMGELGLLGVLVPESYGGAGLGYKEYVHAIIELGKADGAIGLSMAAHNSLCTNHILQFGTEDQKLRYLPRLASGELIGAWGLTEQGTGSDAGNMTTTATLKDGQWIINGGKNFITHGISGDIAVVVARTGNKGDSRGMSSFIIEKGTPGFKGGKKEDKLGMRASETASLFMDECRIDEGQIIGEVGEGFIQSLKVLDGGRISIAALSIGIAKGAYEAALQYSKERRQFGKSISEFQAIAFKLADMASQIDAAYLLTMRAAEMKDRGENVTRESAMAKYYASEVSVKVSTEAVQIFGGYGYTKDYPVEKHYRDSKLCTIGEGTSEIQKLVISRQILK